MFRRLTWLWGITLILLFMLTYWLSYLRAYQPWIAAATLSNTVLIDAVLYDGYEYGDSDEAIALRNVSEETVDLSGFTLDDGETRSAALPPDTWLQPGQLYWLAKDEVAFYRQFGFKPDLVVNSWPRLANSGDEVILRDKQLRAIDRLVYGNGDTDMGGWVGPAVEPYSAGGLFGQEGQILYRKRDQATGHPVRDTDNAEDWAQSMTDPLNGRRPRYPAWDLDEFQFPVRIEDAANLTIAIAPDNALETVVELITNARTSVAIEVLTIENLVIGEALASAAARGVSVKLLLEGNPVGGIAAQQKFICQRIEKEGGQCWFMIRDDEQRVHDRYRYLHAKFILVDGQQVAISSENLSPNSMPYDDKSDGTWGRRGVILITDAPEIFSRLQAIFDRDLDPDNHRDLYRWNAEHLVYGAPPTGYAPMTESGGISYTVRYPDPLILHGQFAFELQQSPENNLRDQDGLLHLLNRAGEGDSVLVQQLQERPHWGPSNSNMTDDPNPRLTAYLAAARRGARVRLLLDEFFDDADSEISNDKTCRIVNEIAGKEMLDLSCKLGNPTGLGIHNKMILANVAGEGYVHVGSLNGTELSSKGNREVALLVQSDEAYTFLAEMFARDTPHKVYLAQIAAAFIGPASHPLISEVLYDPHGLDALEFVELVNPTTLPVNISNYSLSDATNPADYEDLRRFPEGVIIAPGEVRVVATSGLDYWQEYGRWPDFEILDTSGLVTNLVDDPSWGDPSTFFRLGNLGDEVMLRDRNDQIVDAMAYGSGVLPGTFSCPLLQGANHSFERYPYWRDTDDCLVDFRDWPFPSPGELPQTP